jgi:hypothetical protein
VGAAGTVVLLKALFGSCPTVYSTTGDESLFEAESFSYSIAPLLEARDVDVVRHAVVVDGTEGFDISPMTSPHPCLPSLRPA